MIENKDNNEKSQRKPNVKMTWTGSKVGLTELLFALHYQGAFNNGAADLKEVAEYLEYVFENPNCPEISQLKNKLSYCSEFQFDVIILALVLKLDMKNYKVGIDNLLSVEEIKKGFWSKKEVFSLQTFVSLLIATLKTQIKNFNLYKKVEAFELELQDYVNSKNK